MAASSPVTSPSSPIQRGARLQNGARNSARFVACTVHGPNSRTWAGPRKAGRVTTRRRAPTSRAVSAAAARQAPAPEPNRGAGGPDEQHRPRQLHRHHAKPVAERAGVGREETAGAQGFRLAARRRPFDSQPRRRPALPVVDLQGVRAGLQRHAAHPPARADRGTVIEHDLAVDPHDHAVVGAGAKIDPLRPWREPDAAPADEVIVDRTVELSQEGEVDAGGRLLDDRDHPGVERGRVGVLRERMVVAAREPAGGREAARQEPDERQQDRAGEIPLTEAGRAAKPESSRSDHVAILRHAAGCRSAGGSAGRRSGRPACAAGVR